MASIFYGMAGEGRGHAIRVRTLVEQLRQRHHSVVLFAPGDAYELLEPVYRETEVEVRRFPGLQFHYSRSRKLAYVRTGLRALSYMAGMKELILRLEGELDRGGADLVITDFEPALPWAARRRGIPFVSLNHQHFLVVSDFSALPMELRVQAAFMRPFVRGFYWGQEQTIVSSFYFPPLRPGHERVRQIGVLLRRAILEAPMHHGRHLVAYIRRHVSRHIMHVLTRAGRPVRVYGLGTHRPWSNLSFHDVDEQRFLEDLTTCNAVISTAGNQLVGEALYLGKPVLAFPEQGNFEQRLNGYFLKENGGGTCHEQHELDGRKLRRFMDRIEEYRATVQPARLNGNPEVLALLEQSLPVTPARVRPTGRVTQLEPVTVP